MNIYQMYYSNQKKFNFYVIRDNWVTIIAKVVAIENVEEGKSIKGRYPYFGNPIVIADFYKVEQNETGKPAELCKQGEFIERTQLSCPGNYSYSFKGTDLLNENQ